VGGRDEVAAPLAGILWMVLAATLFAVMSVTSRLASRQVPWTEVAAARAVVGALVAFGVARARRASLQVHDRPRAWARSICGTLAMLCTFYTLGAPSIALGDAVTLGSMTGIFLALLAPRLLGEPSTRRVWVATAVAFAGVALVVGPRFHISGPIAIIATGGALLSAMSMVLLRQLGGAGRPRATARTRESPEAIVVHFSAVAAVVMVALAVPVWRTPDAGGAAMLCAAGVTGGLAQLAMTRAYALEHAAKVGTIGYLAVVLAHLLGVVVLGELPSVDQAFGATLVVGAGVLLGWLAFRDSRALASGRALGTAEPPSGVPPALDVPLGTAAVPPQADDAPAADRRV
jgi:drug/metabolite transporter (DMT)-like permease